MKNLISNLKYFERDYFRIPFRDLKIGILNLWRWLPIVWNDRDWDKHYIMEVLIFKLKKNRQYSIDHGHVVNDNEIRTMSECIELLEKVHNEWDNYEEPAYNKHEEKWGKTEFYTVPCEDRPGSYLLKDRNDEKYTKEENKQKDKERILASKIAYNHRRRDFEVAMEIFVQNFDKWWD